MCYAFDGRDPLLACRGRLDVTDWEAQSGVSALWQAPELDHGCARGPPDHSWTAGLLYASMRFGYNPAARAAAKHIDGWVAMVMYDVTSEGRAALRDLVADSFDIRSCAQVSWGRKVCVSGEAGPTLGAHTPGTLGQCGYTPRRGVRVFRAM